MKPQMSVPESVSPVNAASGWTWPCVLRELVLWAVAVAGDRATREQSPESKNASPACSHLEVQMWTCIYISVNIWSFGLKLGQKCGFCHFGYSKSFAVVLVLVEALVTWPLKTDMLVPLCHASP